MHDSAAMRKVFKTSGILDIQMLVRTELELPEHSASMIPPLTNQENPIVSNKTKDPKKIRISSRSLIESLHVSPIKTSHNVAVE